METALTLAIFLVLFSVIAVPYWIRASRKRKQAVQVYQKNVTMGFTQPTTLHPRIDLLRCIGCASCVRACPENVLGIVAGHAVIVNGTRCIGHALCEEVCPVGAITMGFGPPTQGMEIPYYDQYYQTNIEGLYIVGELGGIGLIRNAINQGMTAIDHIAQKSRTPSDGSVDVVIVGAGPAGISAALAAASRNLSHVVLEQDDLGGSILHYPRQKLVLTSPVELPLFGKLKVSEISKEDLLAIFTSILDRFHLNLRTHAKAESIAKAGNVFTVQTSDGTYTGRNVVLALGRRGSPRKLSVPGENLPKVSYRLIEAETYTQKHILVVGGGDSAVEAAVALSRQRGNTVTLSYRREDFVRLKEKNEQLIRHGISSGAITTMFNTQVGEILPGEVIIAGKDGVTRTLPNDAVFIFAGGELPTEFLTKIGVSLRTEQLDPHSG